MSTITPQRRQQRICQLLAQRGECSVECLMAELGVSGMSVRRDLKALAEQGKLIRTHGGATLADRVTFEFAFLNRAREHESAKESIARVVADLIGEHQTVLLDSGTTTLAIARRLRGKAGLTVVTSSLPIAAELQYQPQIEVVLVGGYLRADSPDLVGAMAESNIEGLRTDWAFIGADGIDRSGSVFNHSLEVARLLGKMAAAARNTYVVADGSKLDKTALARFGRVQQWAGLITDAGADAAAVAALRKAGACVIKAPADRE